MRKLLSKLGMRRDAQTAWLYAEHPDLSDVTPMYLIEIGKGDIVVNMLESALEGFPR